MTTVRATLGTPDQVVVGKLARLAQLEATMSSLRHDLRGMLAPALLVVDRLLAHSDPKVVKAGETVLNAITRADERLVATRPPVTQRLFGSTTASAPPGAGNETVLHRRNLVAVEAADD